MLGTCGLSTTNIVDGSPSFVAELLPGIGTPQAASLRCDAHLSRRWRKNSAEAEGRVSSTSVSVTHRPRSDSTLSVSCDGGGVALWGGRSSWLAMESADWARALRSLDTQRKPCHSRFFSFAGPAHSAHNSRLMVAVSCGAKENTQATAGASRLPKPRANAAGCVGDQCPKHTAEGRRPWLLVEESGGKVGDARETGVDSWGDRQRRYVGVHPGGGEGWSPASHAPIAGAHSLSTELQEHFKKGILATQKRWLRCEPEHIGVVFPD